MFRCTAWLLFVALSRSVAIDRDGDFMLALYGVSVHNDTELLVDTPTRHRVVADLYCLDSEVRNNASDNSMFVLHLDLPATISNDTVGLSTNVTESSIDVPVGITLRGAADQFVDPTDQLMYHMRHIAALARTLLTYRAWNDTAVRYNPTLPQLDLWLSRTGNAADKSFAGLSLYLVPRHCRAVLSDFDCTVNRLSNLLPHSDAQIRECVDIWLRNLLEYHRFYRMTDRRLNLHRLSNDCLRSLLGHRNVRFVNCKTEKRFLSENGTDGGDGVGVGTTTIHQYATWSTSGGGGGGGGDGGGEKIFAEYSVPLLLIVSSFLR